MATRFALIICLCLLSTMITHAQDEISTASTVRALVEREPTANNWALFKVSQVPSCRHAIAVNAGDKFIAFLCIEGLGSEVRQFTEEYSSLSGFLVSRKDLSYIKSSSVFFFKSKQFESLFMNCHSFNSNNSGSAFYFWPNIGEMVRNERPVIQINVNGATVQPGSTVLQSIFKNRISITQNIDNFRLTNDFDGNKIELPTLFTCEQFRNAVHADNSPLLRSLWDDYVSFAVTIPAENNNEHADINIVTGCENSLVFSGKLSINELWIPKPLVDQGRVRMSCIVPLREGYVWWEYYPSNKYPNGIWVLRICDVKKNETSILASIRNIGKTFYIWSGNEWQLTNTVDPSLPAVGVVSTGDECFASILGSIYSLQALKTKL